MSMSDPVSAALSKILNYQKAGLNMKVGAPSEVVVPYSRLIHDILLVLLEEGYVGDITVLNGAEEDKIADKKLSIQLLYRRGRPVIQELKRISRPGCRKYIKHAKIPKIKNGLGVSILTTSYGVISDKKAQQLKTGGEVICQVF